MSAWWRGVSAKAKGFLIVVMAVIPLAVILTFFPFVTCEEEAEATPAQARAERRAEVRLEYEKRRRESDRSLQERNERWAKMEADSAIARAKLEADLAARPKRKVRRFQWESPAQTRGKIWNVPDEEGEDAVLTAFLRVCMAEANGNPQDCVGIWQVVGNNRRRTCDRGMIRRITECDDNGETFLSALRRHQRHVLGYMKARNKRAVWIGKMTLDCEDPPDEFLAGQSEQERLNQWDARYQQQCSQVVSDARYLIKGELPPSRPGRRLRWLPGRPITWGGRCETKRASCDDRIACSRGLARVENTDTLNAFWCRTGSGHGCRDDMEPVCIQLGYGKASVVDSTNGPGGQNNSGREEVSSGSPDTDMGRPQDDVQGEEEHLETGASS